MLVAPHALIPPVRLVGLERVEKANVWLTERFFGGAGGDYEKIEALRESVRGMVSAIPDTAKSLLGIQSPSTLFAGIGQNISLGLADVLRLLIAWWTFSALA